MLSSRDVSGWLYLLIGGSVVVTFLLTSRVLDRLASPVPPPPPRIAAPSLQPGASPAPQQLSPGPALPRLPGRLGEAVGRGRAEVERQLAGYGPGRPSSTVRAMVATTWRSGSTFLGDIMQAHPATYYHYEPLLHYDIVQARSGALAEDAVSTLRSLMQCNYTGLGRYLQYGRTHQWLFQHNKPLWPHCVADGESASKYRNSYCWDPAFLNTFCPLFPFQSIKTVRLRLNLTRALVADPGLNLRVLLLVRDPRGTIQSRKHRTWCPGNPDCEDPARLCQDLVDDHASYKRLLREFPGKYKVFRYEDFSMDPQNNTAEVFNFFGFSVEPSVVEFLDSHTKTNIGGVSSTFRDSKTAPFAWREKLTLAEVETIQRKCKKAMRLWGYREVWHHQDQLRSFQPVINLGNFKLQ